MKRRVAMVDDKQRVVRGLNLQRASLVIERPGSGEVRLRHVPLAEALQDARPTLHAAGLPRRDAFERVLEADGGVGNSLLALVEHTTEAEEPVNHAVPWDWKLVQRWSAGNSRLGQKGLDLRVERHRILLQVNDHGGNEESDSNRNKAVAAPASSRSLEHRDQSLQPKLLARQADDLHNR